MNRFVNPLICILSPQKIDMVELVKRHPHIHHKFRKIVDDVLYVLKSKNMKLLRKSDKYYKTYFTSRYSMLSKSEYYFFTLGSANQSLSDHMSATGTSTFFKSYSGGENDL